MFPLTIWYYCTRTKLWKIWTKSLFFSQLVLSPSQVCKRMSDCKALWDKKNPNTPNPYRSFHVFSCLKRPKRTFLTGYLIPEFVISVVFIYVSSWSQEFGFYGVITAKSMTMNGFFCLFLLKAYGCFSNLWCHRRLRLQSLSQSNTAPLLLKRNSLESHFISPFDCALNCKTTPLETK